MELNKIICGDALEVLKTLPSESVHSLVTDPPAGIGFMGKEWDKDKGGRDQWIAWLRAIMEEAFRVMKPGAHGLVWALPRTSHWTAYALENAGFEVRDCLTHLFGSGFPKSLDVSKAIDREAGAERAEGKPGPYASRRVRDSNSGIFVGTVGSPRTAFITEPTTEAAKQWDGWGTALKPASEHWWLIRKPLSAKTVAKNVLTHSTGGLNIQGCRIASNENTARIATEYNEGLSGYKTHYKEGQITGGSEHGRWPANILLSHSEECGETCTDECAVRMLDEHAGELSSGEKKPREEGQKTVNAYGKYAKSSVNYFSANSGSASRFFYVAKPATSERNNGGENKHPTVKSIELMRYLIRLVTPPNGIVLDPFAGSGTTLIAAKEEFMSYVGIELQPEYVAIAERRINSKPDSLFSQSQAA